MICSICHSKKVYKAYKVGNFQSYKCYICGVKFIFPQPNLIEINKINNLKYDTKKLKNNYIGRKDEFIRRAYKCIRFINRKRNKKTILDIGCSFGFYLLAFKQLGFKVIGIDTATDAIQYARKELNLKIISSNFLKHNFKRKKYDIITLFDVFEHFPNPYKALSKINKLQSRKGTIIIQTPNNESLMARIAGKQWFWLLIPFHLYLYTVKSLSMLLSQNNYKIIKVITWDDYSEFINNILYRIDVEKHGSKKAIYVLLYRILWLFYPLSVFWNKFLLGGEIIIYAEKK